MISVIIPTYRPKDYLWECLDSLAVQTLPLNDFEVIIVLNGCREPYLSEIRKYMDKHADMNIRLIQTDKGGVSDARNTGIDNADGQYVAFIDDDDKVSPTYLQEMYEKADEDTVVVSNTYNYLEENPSDLIHVRCTELHKQLSHRGRTSLIDSRRFFFTACMKLIPRKIIGERRFKSSLAIGEDCVFMFLISDRIRHVGFTSENAVYFRRLRSDSALHTHNRKGNVLKNNIRLIMEYTRIYISGIRRYSFHFFLTRIRGAIHII